MSGGWYLRIGRLGGRVKPCHDVVGLSDLQQPPSLPLVSIPSAVMAGLDPATQPDAQVAH